MSSVHLSPFSFSIIIIKQEQDEEEEEEEEEEKEEKEERQERERENPRMIVIAPRGQQGTRRQRPSRKTKNEQKTNH